MKKYIKKFEDIFDRKLKNWTVVVVIIGFLITITWLFTNWVNANLTANVLQSQKNTIQTEQYIIIDGKKFKIILEEVK